jgi:hypothetical protein
MGWDRRGLKDEESRERERENRKREAEVETWRDSRLSQGLGDGELATRLPSLRGIDSRFIEV